MSEILLAEEFVYTVNNVDTTVHLMLTAAGISLRDGKGAHSYRLKYIHLTDVIGLLRLLFKIVPMSRAKFFSFVFQNVRFLTRH